MPGPYLYCKSAPSNSRHGVQQAASLTNPTLENLAKTFEKDMIGNFYRFGISARLRYSKVTATPMDLKELLNGHFDDRANFDQQIISN